MHHYWVEAKDLNSDKQGLLSLWTLHRNFKGKENSMEGFPSLIQLYAIHPLTI